ncbi:MAG: hypothetical protein NTW29_13440 [Bacteroidetes bacterium]|nr:hypothetical protein [Bacteroidota bacterium]
MLHRLAVGQPSLIMFASINDRQRKQVAGGSVGECQGEKKQKGQSEAIAEQEKLRNENLIKLGVKEFLDPIPDGVQFVNSLEELIPEFFENPSHKEQ